MEKLMELDENMWFCSWNSDQKQYTKLFQGVVGWWDGRGCRDGGCGGGGLGGGLMTISYEIDPLCLTLLSEIKNDNIKFVILVIILMYLFNLWR